MSDVIIRGLGPRDIQSLLNLWNQSVPVDGVNLDLLERKVLLDANFDPEGMILAEKDGKLVGFMLCIVRLVPMEAIGMQEDLGWITMFGVHPDYRRQGIGSKLWEKAESFFRERKRKMISIATYSPNYFIPGLDIHEYADGILFLESKGFVQGSKPLSMDNPIVKYKIPQELVDKEKKIAAEGIVIRPYTRDKLMDYLNFQKKHMPGDWLRGARENLALLTLGKFKEEQILLAMKGDEIVGYAQYEEDHFGPFGVADEYQGKGIGQVLLGKTIESMHQRGHHVAWFLWTDDKAAHVYAKVGFRESRRFAVMKKELKYE